MDVDDELRDQFQEMTTKSKLCHASKGYSLDTKYEEARDAYHKLMNCMFNDAMQKSVNKMHADFRKTLSTVTQRNARVLEDLSFETDGCSLEKVQAEQKGNGYESLCETEGDNPTIDKNYSSCHVAEAAMNEFCGYQEYLKWKTLDYKSFEKEYPAEDFNQDYLEQGTAKSDERVKAYDGELKKEQKALEEMVLRYQKWEQSYRMHMWFVAILDSLKETKRMLNELKVAVYQFPDKFAPTPKGCACVAGCP